LLNIHHFNNNKSSLKVPMSSASGVHQVNGLAVSDGGESAPPSDSLTDAKSTGHSTSWSTYVGSALDSQTPDVSHGGVMQSLVAHSLLGVGDVATATFGRVADPSRLEGGGLSPCPPPLTGGHKPVGVKISVDWLAITFHPTIESEGEVFTTVDVVQVVKVASVALACTPEDWVELPHGALGYRFGLVGPGGARIWWAAPHRDDFHLVMPGKACQIVGPDRLRAFMRFALARGGKCTRADSAMDDYDRIVSPGEVCRAIQGPDVVTHAQKWLNLVGGDVRSSEIGGATVYLGASGSRQKLRVYDKGLQSGGEIDAIRWELETRKEAAQTMMENLAGHSVAAWGQYVAARLVAFVDFRDASSHSEIEKRVEHRLPWFKALVGLVEKARAYPPVIARTIEQVVDWVDHAVGSSLALVLEHCSGDMSTLVGIIRRGRERWKPKHVAILAEARLVPILG